MKKFIVTAALGVVSLIGTSTKLEAAVARQNRVLVVVSELDTRGARELEPLYRTLEHFKWPSWQ